MSTEHITATEYRQKYGKAKGRGHIQGRMNGTEGAFASVLEMQKETGEIISYKFESVKLRLADNTYYTPDFMVIGKDGYVIFYEVKGFWRDDARVKIKVASEMYPEFEFIAVQKKNGEWKFEYF